MREVIDLTTYDDVWVVMYVNSPLYLYRLPEGRYVWTPDLLKASLFRSAAEASFVYDEWHQWFVNRWHQLKHPTPLDYDLYGGLVMVTRLQVNVRRIFEREA